MAILDLLTLETTLSGLRASDKAEALKLLSERAAAALGLDADVVQKALLEREALGSTGVGAGVALPHARIAGLARLFGLFARLTRPIDFAAVDGGPVDLVFLLLTPDAAAPAYLKALASISRVLRDPAVGARLRKAGDAAALRDILAGSPGGKERIP